jgi:RNase adaptor protein for sRNA GlmZ degradation
MLDMADRRAKQRAFEEKQMQRKQCEVNEERALTIYTASIHFKSPPETDHVFDLSSVQLDINFPLSQSALDPELFETIISISKFQQLLQSYLTKIESKNFDSILITCVHGMHRSVAMAEAIKQKYPLATCNHLMLQ